MNEDQLLDKFNKLEKEVAELKKMIQQRQLTQFNPPHQNNDICIDGGEHDYPDTWFGIIPPYCKKCNKQAQQYIISYSNGSSDAAGWNFDNFGGNIKNSDNFYYSSTFNTTNGNSQE